jgi:hypothetical protein
MNPRVLSFPRFIVLSRTHWLILAFALVLLLLLLSWALLHPAVYAYWCEREYIPSVQAKFGFRAARIAVPEATYRPLAVVDVTPNGALSSAGIMPGDIPVEYHGGLEAFCGALQSAEEGTSTQLAVINVRDWAGGYEARRELRVPAVALSR